MAICALGRGDWTAVESFVEEARSAVQQFGLGDYTESALAYTLAARAALHRGDVERAHDEVTRAARLRPLLTYARPAYSVQTLVELARTYLALEDPAGAREVLRQARDILQKRPDLGVLPKEVDELESKLDTMRTGNVGASSLTAAELRLVPFLPTHLTLPAGRRAAPPLAEHGEVPGDLDLSEAGGLFARRSDRAAPRDRAARDVDHSALCGLAVARHPNRMTPRPSRRSRNIQCAGRQLRHRGRSCAQMIGSTRR